MTLAANTTFLPVLDDLLSPDLRPILQTPTAEVYSSLLNFTSTPKNTSFGVTNNSTLPLNSKRKSNDYLIENGNGKIGEEKKTESIIKIQKWWRNHNNRRGSLNIDIGAERVKHSIRHHRTEEHIMYLEREVNRLKSALSAERKLRNLQLDAIRSLWSQVQKISTTPDNINLIPNTMTQSMPNGNGILNSTFRKNLNSGVGGDKSIIMSQSFGGGIQESESETCCSKEIKLLRETMSREISQLRDMIQKLNNKNSNNELIISERESGTSEPQPQRPFSLNIIGVTSSTGSGNIGVGGTEQSEISSFAGEMAKNVLEKAVENEGIDNNDCKKLNQKKFFNSP